MDQENKIVDFLNYLAIVSLENIGNFAPSEKEIVAMEQFLGSSIEENLNFYKEQFFKKSRLFMR